MSNMGIIGVIAALLAAGSSFGKKPGTGIPYQDAMPGTTPGTGTSSSGGTDVFGIPKTKTNIYVEPLKITTTPAGISVLNQVAPAAVKQPVVISSIGRTRTTAANNPTPSGQTTVKASGWTWITPEGPVTSRPQTPEEQQDGLGCPEVPNIWDFSSRNPDSWRYCANQNCPSNQREWIEVSAEGPHWSDPTPAVLNQEVGSDNIVKYFCSVCRTYQ